MSQSRQSWQLKFIALAILTLAMSLSMAGSIDAESQLPNSLSQIAQATSGTPTARVRIQDAWQQIYQKLPDLPLENQYVNRETGKVDPNNTFVSRLIRYHYYIKGRPVNYRLDWKFTLADFLGLNEPIEPATYPGADNLRKNPFESDRAIIQKLNRKQRDALIQALVNVFSPTP